MYTWPSTVEAYQKMKKSSQSQAVATGVTNSLKEMKDMIQNLSQRIKNSASITSKFLDELLHCRSK